jgi:hypothetical protein
MLQTRLSLSGAEMLDAKASLSLLDGFLWSGVRAVMRLTVARFPG